MCCKKIYKTGVSPNTRILPPVASGNRPGGVALNPGYGVVENLRRKTIGCNKPRSKASGFDNVIKITDVIVNTHRFQYLAEASHGNSESIGAAESAELASPFDVRLQVKENTRHPETTHSFRKFRKKTL